MASPFYIDSDNLLYFRNVKDKNGEPLVDGTCTYEIRSKHKIDGVYVTLDSGELPNVGTNNYEKVIDASVFTSTLVSEGDRYLVFAVFTDPDGNDLKKRIEIYGTYS